MGWTLSLLLVGLLAQESTGPADWHWWLNRGSNARSGANYQEAADAFQKAIDLSPNEVAPHLELADTWLSLYIPGAQTPDNADNAQRAETEFMEVLRLEPDNETAVASLASLSYMQAQGAPDLDQKLRALDKAASWYERVLAIDPQAKDAYYSLGVIDWVRWYPNWLNARQKSGMKPTEPGPLPITSLRREMLEQYGGLIEHGISNLKKALAIDPSYDDAMAYMNLLVRESADLRDSPEEYNNEMAMADQWVERALDSKKLKAREASGERPLPIQQVSRVRYVNPVYPPLAREARIQGTVRFTAILDREGHVKHLQLISGHPLLVASAREAASQWEFRQTLLNGEPVEVVTQVEVDFRLGLTVQQ